MKFQDYIIDATRSSSEALFRYAKAVPADKVDWSPLDAGRSVLDICREIAMTPTWAADTIEGVPAEWSEEAFAKIKEEQSQWKTIDACEAEYKRRAARMEEVYGNVSDEKLKETRFLPYDGGRDFTYQEMMNYARWNCDYHVGQIAYIQILLGDREMH